MELDTEYNSASSEEEPILHASPPILSDIHVFQRAASFHHSEMSLAPTTLSRIEFDRDEDYEESISVAASPDNFEESSSQAPDTIIFHTCMSRTTTSYMWAEDDTIHGIRISFGENR
ncbi:uncharacterized protein H6S33_007056 [Morchella sextelata]|uniref:uncharacterized protein n=1 Tax=Morchella sextelata TaxID=1174677 RepID=UPI001D0578B3|nr:uncharacterized protein H6S33_007056 [Morchella sextelata]KAH0604025.1 hypothetical protein H6S33_007056 [Morchella sextelata]